MSQMKYSEMHLFIDETGQFTGDQYERFRAVGGVLFLGAYDQGIEHRLLGMMQEGVEGEGGQFPRDLHYSDKALGYKKMDAFLEGLSGALRSFDAVQEQREIYGVSIAHESDVYAGRSTFLQEQSDDNRYASMLEALIEYLVFVDPKLHAKLEDDWQLHLHVAERSVVANAFGTDVGDLEDIKARGYRVGKRKDGSRDLVSDHMVYGTLNVRDLQSILHGLLKANWKTRGLNLGHVEVHAIQYQPNAKLSSAGYYLADLYLGQVRGQALRGSPVTLLETFRALRYGPWMPLLAEIGKALDEGNIEKYQSVRAEIERFNPEGDPALRDALARYEAQALALFKANPQRLLASLQSASELVDKPGMTRLGYASARQAMSVLREIGEVSVMAELLYIQAALSHANHSGNVEDADAIWAAFEEADFVFQQEHLPKMAEIRNRRAVNLTDQFRYDEARDVLISLITRTEAAASRLAELYDTRVSQKSFELGACYGTLGQIEAFSGEYEQAVSFFEHALEHFENPNDQLRQWVYIGHAACAMGGEEGKKLWQKVLKNFTLLSGFDHASNSGSQFVVAVYMKACLIFSDDEELENDVNSWINAGFFTRFSDEEKRHHPFGLIHQTVGMSHARLARVQTGESENLGDSAHFQGAIDAFDNAYLLMSNRGSLLQVLALAAKVRRQLLWLEVNPTSEKRQASLGKAFVALRNHLQENFGAPAWAEDETGMASGHFGQLDPGPGHAWEERAQAVLGGIRFNYC